jgi:hypothetical protein
VLDLDDIAPDGWLRASRVTRRREWTRVEVVERLGLDSKPGDQLEAE